MVTHVRAGYCLEWRSSQRMMLIGYAPVVISIQYNMLRRFVLQAIDVLLSLGCRTVILSSIELPANTKKLILLAKNSRGNGIALYCVVAIIVYALSAAIMQESLPGWRYQSYLLDLLGLAISLLL